MGAKTPSYQYKEERRLIIAESLGDLLKFHEVERQEKTTALKFYSAFMAGGIALVVALTKLQSGAEFSLIKLVAVFVIVIVNSLMIKKLLAVRQASNNIYNEYGRRLEHLIDTHSHDMKPTECEDLKTNVMQKYFGTVKDPKKLWGSGSADKYEVYGLSLINVLFSFAMIVPLVESYRWIIDVCPEQLTLRQVFLEWREHFCLLLIYFVWEMFVVLWSLFLIWAATSAPGTEKGSTAAGA